MILPTDTSLGHGDFGISSSPPPRFIFLVSPSSAPQATLMSSLFILISRALFFDPSEIDARQFNPDRPI